MMKNMIIPISIFSTLGKRRRRSLFLFFIAQFHDFVHIHSRSPAEAFELSLTLSGKITSLNPGKKQAGAVEPGPCPSLLY
ncbi:MAG: hypothetical protein IJH93_01735 [Lachnospiraceae bacterium]|nr:hypothetical protein [Lachnospiraceae bacterium]